MVDIIKQVRWWHFWDLQWLVWVFWASARILLLHTHQKSHPNITLYLFSICEYSNIAAVFIPSPSSRTQHSPCVGKTICKCLSSLCYAFVLCCHYDLIFCLSVHEGAHHFPILLSSLLMTPSLLSTLYLLSEGHPPIDFDQIFDSNQ